MVVDDVLVVDDDDDDDDDVVEIIASPPVAASSAAKRKQGASEGEAAAEADDDGLVIVDEPEPSVRPSTHFIFSLSLLLPLPFLSSAEGLPQLFFELVCCSSTRSCPTELSHFLRG